jgi:hypothetical protein
MKAKTAARHTEAGRAAGLIRDCEESQLTDELVAAVRPAGHGAS